MNSQRILVHVCERLVCKLPGGWFEEPVVVQSSISTGTPARIGAGADLDIERIGFVGSAANRPGART